MKRNHRSLLFIIGCFVFLLGGCGLIPEPASLIQSPQIVSTYGQKLVTDSINYVPKGMVPIVPNAPLGNELVLASDLTGDGKLESVVFYQSVSQSGEVGAMVLNEKENELEKIFSKSGAGYEISWGSTNDLTGDGKEELLIGWKIGNMAGNVLEIYTFHDREFKLLDKVNYHELEVIRYEGKQTYSLAVWEKESDDIYNVKLLKWDRNHFSLDEEGNPYYFPKVEEYYKKRSLSVPDKAQYWYYLAEAHLKANHPGEALLAINEGMERKIVNPSYSDFENLKSKIQSVLNQEDSPVTYLLREAGLKIGIPKQIATNISLEGKNGPAANYILTVAYSSNSQEKKPLFSIEIYAKDMTYEDIPLEKITESEQFFYYMREENEDEALKKFDPNYQKVLALKEKIISSITPDSTEPLYSSFEEVQVVNSVSEAVNKYWYVTSGGNMEGEIKSLIIKDQDYRYMGKDLDTKKKLTDFLEESYTSTAVNGYIKRARIVEVDGHLAQPNADGGSLVNYQRAKVSDGQGDSNERKFDLMVPLGSSVFYEYIHAQFQRTSTGWKISSEPGSF